jgi:hypothetical protein
MIRAGTSQTTISIFVECAHFGKYSADVFDALYFHANKSVRKITGTTTISMAYVDVRIRFFSASPTLPFRIEKIHLAAAT